MKLREVRAPRELYVFEGPMPAMDAEVGCLHCLKVHRFGDYTVRRGLILCPEPDCDGSLIDVVEDLATLGPLAS